MIAFKVCCNKLHQHIFDIELSIKNPQKSQELMLPNWIAGSYKIRDYARNITNIAVKSGEITQISKNRFVIKGADDTLVVSYSVYGFEQSVRHSYLSEERAFFNGSSLFLLPLGFENSTYNITLEYPKQWQVATSLDVIDGCYRAESYNELIDAPFELANFDRFDFQVGGIPHSLVISGNYQSDTKKLVADITTICTHHQKLFGNFPVEKYLFLTLATYNNFGGLEHTKSTSLICARKELINTTMNPDYMRFLSLCSHEYFHTWWIKTLKPKEFLSLDLEKENHTTQLWIFEGITSYYDDYSLYLCGLINYQQYLDLFAKTVNKVLQSAGNFKQSLTDASFNAWTHLYQAGENYQNDYANYYSKGALVAFLLDVEVQKRTQKALNLSHIVKHTYDNFTQAGLQEGDFQKVLEALTGSCFQEFFDNFVYGTTPLPLQEAFAFNNVEMIEKPKTISLGCEIQNNKITQVKAASIAEAFGLYVGDEIVLVNGEKVENTDKTIAKFQQGDKVDILILRDNLQITKVVQLNYYHIPEVILQYNL